MAAVTSVTVRVALVDDHPVVLSGLDAALATVPGLLVVAHGATVADARRIADRADVDVILLDVRLPDGNGLELVSEISTDGQPAIIVLSSFKTSQYVAAAVRFGAQGFLLKTAPLDDLVEAIKRVADGGSAFTTEQLREGRSGFVSLSRREQEVLRLVLRGLSNDEIGAELHVSGKTIEAHLSRLYGRIGVVSRIELALRAEREGWLEIGEPH
jgi:DNA-binding NarL/FixJ family response regulator